MLRFSMLFITWQIHTTILSLLPLPHSFYLKMFICTALTLDLLYSYCISISLPWGKVGTNIPSYNLLRASILKLFFLINIFFLIFNLNLFVNLINFNINNFYFLFHIICHLTPSPTHYSYLLPYLNIQIYTQFLKSHNLFSLQLHSSSFSNHYFTFINIHIP